MGLISGISRIITKAPKVASYSYEGIKRVPYIIFGNGADQFVKGAKSVTKAANESWGSAIWKAVKTGGKSVTTSKSFFKDGYKAIKSIPRAIKVYAKKGSIEAGVKGTNKILGGLKGAFKGIGKKMPILGNLMLVAFEIPNIVKATKEQGIGQGVAEVGKAAARLTGASIGAAIGSAVCPVVGSLIGWIAGEWLVSKVVGKSYSEKVAEQEEKQQEDLARLEELQNLQYQQTQAPSQQVNPASEVAQNTTNPQTTTNPFSQFDLYNQYNDPYANDIMAQGLKFNQVA